MELLAQKLRVLRAKSGLKNKEIANLINKSEQTVSGYMSLENPVNPDLDTLKRLAEIFAVSTDYLLNNSNGQNNDHIVVKEKPNPYGLEKHQMELLEMIEAADDKTQDMIWKVIDTILATRKQNK